MDQMEVKRAVQSGNVQEAIEKINDLTPTGIPSFFCLSCLSLMRSDTDIINHLRRLDHEVFWASLDDNHELSCFKCGDEFNSRSDVDKHWSDDHMTFILKDEPNLKMLTEQITPSPAHHNVDSRMKDVKKGKGVLKRQPNWSLPTRSLQFDDDSPDNEGGLWPSSSTSDSDDEGSPILYLLNYLRQHSQSGESSYNDSSSDDSTYEDDPNKYYPPLVQCRTLKNMNIGAQKRKELRSKYIIAEGVPKTVALKRVKKALERYSTRGYFNLWSKGKRQHQGTEAVTFDSGLKQVCMKKLKKYRCSEAKGLRMKKVLEIIERMLEDENVGERENIFHYMYHQELAEPALKDDQLQKRIGRAILTISEMLRVSRESLKIRPACKGLILGPVHLFHGNDLICNCNLGGESGSLIPSEADLISNIEATGTVKYVLVIEKDTVFHYLAGKNFHRSESCILICGKGQPDVATRILVRKLKDKFPLVRFYALVDFNPSGLGIFWTYCFGSDVRAHDNLLLTVSDLEFIGLHPDDVKVEELMPFENSGAARLISLMNKSYLVKDRGLREALFQLDVRQSKADIEVLMKRKVLMDVIRNRINFSEENTIAAEVDDVAGQLEAAHMLDTTE